MERLNFTASSVIELALPFLDPLVFIEIVAVEPAQNQRAVNKMAASKPLYSFPSCDDIMIPDALKFLCRATPRK
jgi:hypothetical protein